MIRFVAPLPVTSAEEDWFAMVKDLKQRMIAGEKFCLVKGGTDDFPDREVYDVVMLDEERIEVTPYETRGE